MTNTCAQAITDAAKAAGGLTVSRGLRGLTLAGLLAMGAMLPGVTALTSPAHAQNLFAPRLHVNGAAITGFEIQQRAEFVRLLGGTGDPEQEAIKALTEDRLRTAEAKRLGIKVTPEQIMEGMTEFASRANMTADQMVEALGQAGVGPETFRDFVHAGLLWREALRQRYAGRISVSEADIDKAFENATRERALKVLVSELVIPIEPGNEQAALALAERLSREITSEGAFASAAGRHSASPTAGRGGRLDWLPLANLPAPIAQQILALGKGEVSKPVMVPNAVVLFQLRDIAKDTSQKPTSVQVDWVELVVPNDPARISQIVAAADSCKDLYPFNKGQPAGNLREQSASMAEVPQDIGLQLARLDIGEISTALGSGAAKRLVMLCARKEVREEEISRQRMGEIVTNQKLEGLSNNYLEELRSSAFITQN